MFMHYLGIKLIQMNQSCRAAAMMDWCTKMKDLHKAYWSFILRKLHFDAMDLRAISEPRRKQRIYSLPTFVLRYMILTAWSWLKFK